MPHRLLDVLEHIPFIGAMVGPVVNASKNYPGITSGTFTLLKIIAGGVFASWLVLHDAQIRQELLNRHINLSLSEMGKAVKANTEAVKDLKSDFNLELVKAKSELEKKIDENKANIHMIEFKLK